MKVIGVLLLLASAMCAMMQAEGASINRLECEEDHQCDMGKFCYKTRHCVSCINCKNYHRLQSEEWTCSKEAQYCGGCLSGYKEELLTEGRVRDTCVPIQSPQEDHSYPHYLYLIIGVGVGVFIALVIVSAGIYVSRVAEKKEENHNARRSSNHDENRARFRRTSPEKNYLYQRCIVPPSAPLLPPLEFDSNARIAEDVEHQFCYGNHEKCSVLPTQAKPVDYPTNECCSSNDSTEEVSPHQDYGGTAEGGHIFPPPLYNDSNWSLTYNYVETPIAVDSDGDVMSPINEEVETMAGIDEREETGHEEEKVSETNLNDSGVCGNSCQTSNSSLIHPFAHLGSAGTSSLQETRGIICSHSEDDLSTRGRADKRQKQDDTLSLDEGTVSDI